MALSGSATGRGASLATRSPAPSCPEALPPQHETLPSIARPQASVEQIRDYLEHLITTDKRLVVLETVDGVATALAPFKAARVRAGEGAEPAGARALAELRLLAEDGADYLVVPRSSDEWLDASPGFAAAVESGCRKIAEQRHLCRVFDLEGLKEIA